MSSTLLLCSLLCRILCLFLFFFFKQKTAYEMRISDWSSDVCSSDLASRVSSRRRFTCPRLDQGSNSLVAQIKNFESMSRLDEVTRHGEIGRASCRERVCQYV